MDPTPLLEYAATNRPSYFEADEDIEIYNQDEEEWNTLYSTSYSLASLIDALRTGGVESQHVRFSVEDAGKYLHHLSETEIDEKLHHEDLMNRERLVAFADAGYTAVDDLFGTADKFDLARDTGVDEDVVSSIATNHMGGFSTGSTFRDSGPLDALSPDDSFMGWTLVEATPYRIRWVSPGRFNLTISPAPEEGTMIAVNTPDAERSAWYRKGRSVEVGPDNSISAEDALRQAHEWLDANQLEYDDDLAELPHIGAATRDFLVLEYGITTRAELREFAEDEPDEFETVFASTAQDRIVEELAE